MIKWRLGEFCEKESVDLGNDDLGAIKTKYYNGDANGYNEHTVEIHLHKDGSLNFSDPGPGEGFIYLYPKQTIHLFGLLRDSGLYDG
jgi:hypothetical protein